jgi:hypothetical protein
VMIAVAAHRAAMTAASVACPGGGASKRDERADCQSSVRDWSFADEQNPLPFRFRHSNPTNRPSSSTTASRRMPDPVIHRWAAWRE